MGVRHDLEGKLERLPDLEESVTVSAHHDISSYWKSARGHCTTYVMPPSNAPKQVTEPQVVNVMSQGAEYDWERSLCFSPVEANIAAGSGDILAGLVLPDVEESWLLTDL